MTAADRPSVTDNARAETTTATNEDARALLAEIEWAVEDYRKVYAEPHPLPPNLSLAVRAAGLLATARTRPTETEWAVRGQHTGSITPQHGEKHARAIANALPYYSVVRREVGPWTEAE